MWLLTLLLLDSCNIAVDVAKSSFRTGMSDCETLTFDFSNQGKGFLILGSESACKVTMSTGSTQATLGNEKWVNYTQGLLYL